MKVVIYLLIMLNLAGCQISLRNHQAEGEGPSIQHASLPKHSHTIHTVESWK